jgi:nucleoside-diphosphate-sugar epimerase
VPDAHIDITTEVSESGYRSARHINSRIAEALEFRPQWSLERGVRATVNWARQRAGLAPVA